jgi:5-oxoprolinase (ATP-hydrolysing) subunit A
MLTRIDLNSDMGERGTPEGLAIEAEMMPLITSVNIACGGHAGTPELMRRTARLAAQYGIGIGAHPGLRDPEHFGRTERSLSPREVEALVIQQLHTLANVLAQDRLSLAHVKPHGALYNMATKNLSVAQAIVRAMEYVDRTLFLYALAGSVLVKAAQAAGLTIVQEAFADRAYRADGTLIPRSEPGALLTSEETVRQQLHELINGSVTSLDGHTVPIQADSVCLHSDTPHAVTLARMIRHELQSAGIQVSVVRHEDI